MEPQENEPPYQPESKLMQLPEDIIYLLQPYLDPVAKIAFSLACRSLHERYFAGARKARHKASDIKKRHIIFLLEKDASNRDFFCPCCRRFRSFGAGSREGLGTCSFDMYHYMKSKRPSLVGQRDACPGRRLAINDHRGPEINFHLGRLVMNGHLFGEDRGLPLSCLEFTDLTVKAEGVGKYAFTWKQTQRARIIDDQLFLRCTHVLDQAEQEDIDAGALKLGLEALSHYNFCKHRYTGTTDNTFFNPNLFRRWLPLGSSRLENKDLFIAHSESEFGCRYCHTNYTSTAEWREKPRGKGSWVIRVDAYHQLGAFRHADDGKFRLMCSRTPQHSFFAPPPLFANSVGRAPNGWIWATWHGSKEPPPPGY